MGLLERDTLGRIVTAEAGLLPVPKFAGTDLRPRLALGVSDALVSEDGDTLEGLGVDESHGSSSAGIAEKATAGAEHHLLHVQDSFHTLSPREIDLLLLHSRGINLCSAEPAAMINMPAHLARRHLKA